MTQYAVTWTLTGEFADEHEACNAAYRELCQIVAKPYYTMVNVSKPDEPSEASVELCIFDGVIKTDPLFASQIMGFRHLIWVQQSHAQSQKLAEQAKDKTVE